MITEQELKNMIDVEITIINENFSQLSDEHKEWFKDFDVYSECEINDTKVLLFEDFGVIAPIGHYDNIVKILELMPMKSFRFRIYNDYSEEIITSIGDFDYELNDCHILTMKYN
jgi:hypothetical protein